MFYGTAVWDPVLIVAQIVTVQCLFYVCLGTFLYVFLATSRPQSGPLSIVYVFDYHKVAASTAVGWTVIFSFLASAVSGSVILYFVVERTKKCLDFTVTCYLFHLLFCMCYGGFPLSIQWWITIGLSAACMTLLGETLCMKREMRDIPTTTTSGRSAGSRARVGLGTSLSRISSQVKIASSGNSSSKRQRLINFLSQV
mmetsp:Transcript_10313/g.28043  ORF Transcript_10313/g.28043 Transcript_10313/m.28043 type:complete len:198 (+) Transcript_10313:93-686(+)